ncbi:NfeD family protein [Thiolapillus sp.]|uniref:NfeD family protein n=1 Tax=Thiolapillus sp. TaxID=2017437 RepID=UPI003AF6158A
MEVLPWYWMAGGIVLIILEVFAPGTILVWMGLSAVAVGMLLNLAPNINWYAQGILFAPVDLAWPETVYRPRQDR